MNALYTLLGLGLLVLNIIILIYFFKACANIESIKKGVGMPNEKDFYNQFLKLISQNKQKEAAEILHEHFWSYCSFYQTSSNRVKEPDKEKKQWEEYTAPYKNLFELVGEKMPNILAVSIVRKVEESEKSIKENQEK